MLSLVWRAALVALALTCATHGVALGGNAPPTPININQASVEELMQLPNVGRKRAETIVAQRAKRPFQRPSDLMRVRGIGRKTFARLQPHVTVTSPTAKSATPATATTASAKPSASAQHVLRQPTSKR